MKVAARKCGQNLVQSSSGLLLKRDLMATCGMSKESVILWKCVVQADKLHAFFTQCPTV